MQKSREIITMSQHSPLPVQRLGNGKLSHFFGYYNKTVWDKSGRYVLVQQVPWADHKLNASLNAAVGYFDLNAGNDFQLIENTQAWNWQMGSQLQWLDGMPGQQVIYNVRTSQQNTFYPSLGSVIYDLQTKTRRLLPMPVYVVAPDSKFALSVNYRRLYVTHPTIGYCDDNVSPANTEKYPANDGLHYIDLHSGETQLIKSYQDLFEFHHKPSMNNAIHWVSHIEINPQSNRVLFLHRWTERVEDETCFLHRLITMNPDGGNMRLLECSDHPLPQLGDHFDPNSVGVYDYEKSEYQISHPMWCDNNTIIVWGPHAGSIHYHKYHDNDENKTERIADGILTENGHMSYSPVNPDWLLTDTYPDSETSIRQLLLFNCRENKVYPLGSFYTPPSLIKENRCDLHPRWHRQGKQVCIDSFHEGSRQMYIIDVSQITG